MCMCVLCECVCIYVCALVYVCVCDVVCLFLSTPFLRQVLTLNLELTDWRTPA